MARTLLGLLAVALLLYAGICLALWAFQRSLIYFPQPLSPGSTPPALRLAVAGGDVLVSTRPLAGAQAVLYFGGNAEDVSVSLPDLAQAFPAHALYLMHYRGYGGSFGTPSEAALFADALALFDRLQAQHGQITVVGRSLGSGVAVHLASLRPVARLVLVTPYDSIEGIAAQQFPWAPVRWLLQDKFDSGTYAAQVKAPTLLVAAEHDEVIPRASTEQLLKRFAPGMARLAVVPGTGHNTIQESGRYAGLLAGR